MNFENIKKVLDVRCPGMVTAADNPPSFQVEPTNWSVVADVLKNDADLTFDSLMCLSGFDLGDTDTLGIAYRFYSMDKRHSLEIIINVSKENPSVPSVANIWRTADWHEREAFDLYGIIFEGHPDRKRILLPDYWEGYPLRTEYIQPETFEGITTTNDKTYWE